MNGFVRDNLLGFRQFVGTFGAFQMFFFRLLPYLPKSLLRPRLIIEQIYSIGAL